MLCVMSGVDVILDNIGGPYLQRNIDSLNFDGRLFIIGFMGGTVTEVNLVGMLARRLTVQGNYKMPSITFRLLKYTKTITAGMANSYYITSVETPSL